MAKVNAHSQFFLSEVSIHLLVCLFSNSIFQKDSGRYVLFEFFKVQKTFSVIFIFKACLVRDDILGLLLLFWIFFRYFLITYLCWLLLRRSLKLILTFLLVDGLFFPASVPKVGVSKQCPAGHMQPRMAVKAAQHKITHLLRTLWVFFVIMCHSVFNVWPKTTLLLPVWRRDAKRLDGPGKFFV